MLGGNREDILTKQRHLLQLEDKQYDLLLKQNSELLDLAKSKQNQIELQSNAVKQLKAEIEKYRSEVKDQRVYIEKLQQKIRDLYVEQDILKQKNFQIAQEKNKFKQQLQEYQALYESSQTEINSLQGKLEKLSFNLIEDYKVSLRENSSYISTKNELNQSNSKKVLLSQRSKDISKNNLKKLIFEPANVVQSPDVPIAKRKSEIRFPIQSDLKSLPQPQILDVEVKDYSIEQKEQGEELTTEQPELLESILPIVGEEDNISQNFQHKSYKNLNLVQSTNKSNLVGYQSRYTSLPTQQPQNLSQSCEEIPIMAETEESPIKKLLPQLNEVQHPLYEKFLIISTTRQQIQASNPQNLKNFYCQQEILFNYPPEGGDLDIHLNIVPQLIYPYGVPVVVSEKRSSLSNLSQVIMKGTYSDRVTDTFVFELKTQQYFENDGEGLLTCVCVEIMDFFNHTETNNKQNLKKRFKKQYYQVMKTYCFITRRRDPGFLIDILKLVINTLKCRKAQIFSISNPEQYLEKIDNMFFQSMKGEISQFLQNVLNQFTKDNQTLKFLESSIKQHQTPTEYPELQWGLQITFHTLHLGHFIYLLLLILTEQNICLLSSSKTKLSALIRTLPTLIQPFQYPHPSIYTLSHSMLPMLESPIPFIAGLLLDSEGLKPLGITKLEQLYQSYPNIIFFDIDSLKFLNLPFDLSRSEIFRILSEELFWNYKNIDKNLDTQTYQSQFHTDSCQTDFKQCLQVAQKTSEVLHTHIIKKIPSNQNRWEFKLLVEEINGIFPKNDVFYQYLLKTQIFAYFLQKQYILI